MKKLCFAALLVLLMPVAALAQLRADVFVTTAENSGCGTGNENKLYLIINASNASDCDSTGGGAANALCLCDGGTMKSVASGYAPLAGADFTGAVSMSADRGVAGDEAISWGTELDLGTSYFSVAATDSDGDAYTTYIGQDGVNYGLWIVPPGATNPSVTLEQSGQLLIDPDDDGTADMNITGWQICLGGACFYGARGGPGALPCDAGSAGSHYYDNNVENQPCFCNGTAYVLFSDATTACTDPE